jgi:hypothetical protein
MLTIHCAPKIASQRAALLTGWYGARWHQDSNTDSSHCGAQKAIDFQERE